MAIDYLILKTEPQESRLKEVDGLLVLDWDEDAPSITTEDINRILEEEYVYPRKIQKPTPRKTSVALSPEAIATVKRCRDAHGVSMSKAISKLIERTE